MSSRLHSLILFALVGIVTPNLQADEINNRKALRDILGKTGLEFLHPEPFEITKKYILGQALFFDPILSSNNDVSCATCHLLSRGTSDGQKKSIIPGGNILGRNGNSDKLLKINARNSLALWNRDDNTVTNLFWDGRVEVLDPDQRIFRTPLGSLLPKSIENALAAQALFPLVSRTEMFSSKCIEQESSCEDLERNGGGPEWIQSVHTLILRELIGDTDVDNVGPTQEIYRTLFTNSYPNVPLESLDIGHVGNAIAHFEEVAFATRDARWDKFLKGDNKVLSNEEVQGAVLFFSKGRCAECHKGPVFSDYLFHTMGIINYKFDDQVDFGRYEVTGEEQDRFKFRTPSLRNVTLTAPYMHDGSKDSLREAIRSHSGGCQADPRLIHLCESIALPSGVNDMRILGDNDIDKILNFLKALEDNVSTYMEYIIPRSVPSGLPIERI